MTNFHCLVTVTDTCVSAAAFAVNCGELLWSIGLVNTVMTGSVENCTPTAVSLNIACFFFFACVRVLLLVVRVHGVYLVHWVN